jgi:hypothetical protein
MPAGSPDIMESTMPSSAMRRFVQAGLTIAAFCLCFGIVTGARAQNIENGKAVAAALHSHSVSGE